MFSACLRRPWPPLAIPARTHAFPLALSQHPRFRPGCVATGLQSLGSATGPEPCLVRDVSVKCTKQQVDYTTLQASTAELQSWIPSRVEQVSLQNPENYTLRYPCSDWEVVQWQKRCIALRLRTDSEMTWLYLSWHPVAARLHCGGAPDRGDVAEVYTFGKGLHRYLRGHVLTSAKTPIPFERAVQLSFSESVDQERKWALWFEAMGSHSNVVLTDEEGEIKLCGHQVGNKQSRLRHLQNGKSYTKPPGQRSIPPDTVTSTEVFQTTLGAVSRNEGTKDASLVSILVRCFQGISCSLARDLLTKSQIPIDVMISGLSSKQLDALFFEFRAWIERLENNTFHPSLSSDTGRYSLVGLPGTLFASVHDLLHTYYHSNERASSQSKLGGTLRGIAAKSLKKLENRRKKLQSSLEDSNKAAEMQKTGDLIISHLYKYVPGSTSMEVEDWETSQTMKIPLDPSKSATDCAHGFFKKAKKMRRAKDSIGPLLENLDQEISYMREVEESLVELQTSDDEADAQALMEIQEELVQGKYMQPPSDHHLAAKAQKKIKASTVRGDPDGVRLFTSPNGFRILVGRNSKQNDLISKTRGKKGDLWFHARGVPGSHVLMKLDGNSKLPTDDDITCAAQLAAFYSKARNGGKVPVSMTNAENVTKAKGAPPGLVQITREQCLTVKPELAIRGEDQNGRNLN